MIVPIICILVTIISIVVTNRKVKKAIELSAEFYSDRMHRESYLSIKLVDKIDNLFEDIYNQYQIKMNMGVKSTQYSVPSDLLNIYFNIKMNYFLQKYNAAIKVINRTSNYILIELTDIKYLEENGYKVNG